MTETSDVIFVEGDSINLSELGDLDFTRESGTPVLEDPDATSFVHEGGVPLSTRSILQLDPPIDVALTADNWIDMWVNSTSNQVYSESGDDYNSDGSACELNWQQANTVTDVALPEDAISIIGVRWWNGPDYANVDPDVGTSQQGFVMSFRGDNGDVVPFTQDTFTLTVDTHFNESEDPNPYGTDWVDPEFDDSGWAQVSPSDENISDGAWGNNDQCLFVEDFFDSDPQWCNQHPDNVQAGDIDQQGYGFARIRVRT